MCNNTESDPRVLEEWKSRYVTSNFIENKENHNLLSQNVTAMALFLGTAGGEFFAVFSPGIDPYAVTAGEGIARDREDFTD